MTRGRADGASSAPARRTRDAHAGPTDRAARRRRAVLGRRPPRPRRRSPTGGRGRVPGGRVIARQGEIGTGFFLIVVGLRPSSATARRSRARAGRVLRRAVGPRRPAAHRPGRGRSGRRAASRWRRWDFERRSLEQPTCRAGDPAWPRRAPADGDRAAQALRAASDRRPRPPSPGTVDVPVHRHRGLDAARPALGDGA